MIKIVDKFQSSIFNLEQMLKKIEEKKSVEIEKGGPEEKFIKVYNSMQKDVHTPEQRKKAEELLKKYNQIQIMKDDRGYPKGEIYKKPLRLDGLFGIMGEPIKINYR